MPAHKKTHCIRGHEFVEGSFRLANGGRVCVLCEKLRHQIKYEETKVLAPPRAEDYWVNDFWLRVDKTPGRGPQGECWQWFGAFEAWGYGKLFIAGKKYRAHRASYELAFGKIEDQTLMVRHSCDNPCCVNPAHLSLGTHEDNMQDMAERGRVGLGAITHCPSGHPYTPENINPQAAGPRCLTCFLELKSKRTYKKPTRYG